jgi:hypothetical protein
MDDLPALIHDLDDATAERLLATVAQHRLRAGAGTAPAVQQPFQRGLGLDPGSPSIRSVGSRRPSDVKPCRPAGGSQTPTTSTVSRRSSQAP